MISAVRVRRTLFGALAAGAASAALACLLPTQNRTKRVLPRLRRPMTATPPLWQPPSAR